MCSFYILNSGINDHNQSSCFSLPLNIVKVFLGKKTSDRNKIEKRPLLLSSILHFFCNSLLEGQKCTFIKIIYDPISAYVFIWQLWNLFELLSKSYINVKKKLFCNGCLGITSTLLFNQYILGVSVSVWEGLTGKNTDKPVIKIANL